MASGGWFGSPQCGLLWLLAVEAGVEEKKEEEKQAAAAAANAKGKKAKGKAKAKNAKKRFYPENIMCDLVAHYVLKWLLLNMREVWHVGPLWLLWWLYVLA